MQGKKIYFYPLVIIFKLMLGMYLLVWSEMNYTKQTERTVLKE